MVTIQIKSIGGLKGWLYRIAHNTIMDFYRGRQPYEALPEKYGDTY